MVGMRVLFATLLWLVWLPGNRVHADDTVVEAEHVRLSVEIERLAQRQAWKGVERRYLQLLALEIQLTHADHMHGAYAARELGHVAACYDRLRAAADQDATKEVIDWLWNIDNNYGHVVLTTAPARAAVLTMSDLPFDPNQRRAIEAAIVLVREEGTFTGMLPRGKYTFAEQSFSVEPGISVRIEVSPRARRQGNGEPTIVYRDSPTIYMGEASEEDVEGEESSEAQNSQNSEDSEAPEE
jgi:hypothetical protein